MSIRRLVILERALLPTNSTWRHAIGAAGFALTLPADLELTRHSGFVPCTLDGHATGFELDLPSVDDLEIAAAVRRGMDARDFAVAFTTHGDQRGLAASFAASAALAALCGGKIWDELTGDVTAADEALPQAREMVASILDDLAARSLPRPPPPAAHVVEVDLAARVVFRGAALLALETQDAAPQRFNLRIETASLPTVDSAVIEALWRHPHGGVSVRALRFGVARLTFDAHGAVTPA